jgi:hypothetical protein
MLHHHAIEATATEVLQCPSCGLPATITDRFTLNGSPGPVVHVKLVCAVGHWFTPPIESLPRRLREPRGVDATRCAHTHQGGGVAMSRVTRTASLSTHAVREDDPA